LNKRMFTAVLLTIYALQYVAITAVAQIASNQSTRQPANIAGSSVAFKFDPLLQPRIVVDVSINGQRPLPFMVDTGMAAELLIDNAAADKLSLVADLQKNPVHIGNIEARHTQVASANLGDGSGDPANNALMRLHCTNGVLIADLGIIRPGLSREPIVGLIGIDALLDHIYRIDFVRHRIHIFSTKANARIGTPRLSYISSGTLVRSVTLPLTSSARDRRYRVQLTLENGEHQDMVIDTGAEQTNISVVAAQRLKPINCKSVGQASAYGMTITPTMLLSSVKLGSLELRNVTVASIPDSPMGNPLGIDVISRFETTLDLPDEQVIFEERSAEIRVNRTAGYTGVHLTNINGQIRIAEVDTGSPAKIAGVTPQCVVTSVDGTQTAGLSIITLRKLVDGFADSTCIFELIRSDGEPQSIKLRRSCEFAKPSVPFDGLFVVVAPHQSMQVMGTLHNSAAEAAGLHIGDEIIEINGIPTKDITSETLGGAYRKQHLALTVVKHDTKQTVKIVLNTGYRASAPQATKSGQVGVSLYRTGIQSPVTLTSNKQVVQ